MARARLKPRSVNGSRVSFSPPPSQWAILVELSALAAVGGGELEAAGDGVERLAAGMLGRLGYRVERLGGKLRVEGEGRGGDIVVNVGCSYDFAVFAGIVAGVLAEPGARVSLRACEELVEADWRPLLETVSAYGGRAWVTGNPSRLVMVEAVGRGRLSGTLWRLQRSLETSAHIAAAIVAALAADHDVHIYVWPRDPPAKTDIDPAVYAAARLSSIEYNAAYSRFKVEPGSPGGLKVYPDMPLALHLAGLAALGARVEIILDHFEAEALTPFNPIRVSVKILDQLGYEANASEAAIRVDAGEAVMVHRLFLYDEPDYAASALTLAAARREELSLMEVPRGYRSDLEDVAGVLASLGYHVELGEEEVKVEPPRLPREELEKVTPVVTCTSPHVPPAALVASIASRLECIVERWDCLAGYWPEFYRVAEALGAADTGDAPERQPQG